MDKNFQARRLNVGQSDKSARGNLGCFDSTVPLSGRRSLFYRYVDVYPVTCTSRLYARSPTFISTISKFNISTNMAPIDLALKAYDREPVPNYTRLQKSMEFSEQRYPVVIAR
jgi:hypothetical protein